MVNPRFQLLSNDKNITDNITKNLVNLRLSEQIGGYSDALTITLADSKNDLALPLNGTELRLSLGFDDKLTQMGLFVIDEVSLQSPPSQLTITARAAPFQHSKKYRAMQTHKSRHFENITLGELANTIASEHGLEASVAERFKTIKLEHVNQQDESNLSLLRRLTEELHARLKVTEGKLALVDLDSTKTNKGRNIPTLPLTPNNLSRWNATLAGRTQYKSVIASYRDLSANKTIEIQAGTEEPTRRLPHLFDDKPSAIRAAQARLAADKTGRGNLKASMPGNPNIKASMLLALTDFREGLNQEWQCISVEHALNNQGFTTQITATIK